MQSILSVASLCPCCSEACKQSARLFLPSISTYSSLHNAVRALGYFSKTGKQRTRPALSSHLSIKTDLLPITRIHSTQYPSLDSVVGFMHRLGVLESLTSRTHSCCP
ncbi:hypothetical protein BDU57DRAFT_511034 [Ampelomyces quisqualis]|uniref:Uncharacterized protein n=1 Tax=Ampelomyces quisqualis TaxID=50730 RepID=A0A6A5R5A2_AMPQU|nr:hypothetical protein BDU57DRAFT_511034 [Ampelomyces quisqualis]